MTTPLGENIGKTLQDCGLGRFFFKRITPKSEATKLGRWHYVKPKSSAQQRKGNKVKRELTQ